MNVRQAAVVVLSCLSVSALAAAAHAQVSVGAAAVPCVLPDTDPPATPIWGEGVGRGVDPCGRIVGPRTRGGQSATAPGPRSGGVQTSSAPSPSSQLTIDQLQTYLYYVQHDAAGPLTIVGRAFKYLLSDASFWSSGSGFSVNYQVRLDHVETVGGTTVRYFLVPPPSGRLYQQADYDNGDHSSQGTLNAVGPLVLEATIGESVAHLHGEALIVDNEATSYGEPRFNFFTSVPGSIVPVDSDVTLSGDVWDAATFDRSFQYTVRAVVDFANPVSTPPVVGLTIIGPERVAANGAYVFAAHAVYPDGSERNVSSKATWSVTPADATVLQGVLTTGSLAVPEEMLTVGASYTEGPSTVTAETQVRFLAADPAEGPNSWPMYQADARHSGFVASAVDPTLFTLHWRKDFTETNSLNPVAAGEGKVFLSFYSYSASRASIFALDAADGTQLWSKDFESGLGIDAPSLGYGNVYVRLSDGYSSAPIVVLTGDSGSELLRTVETQQSIYYHSPLAPTLFDRHLYVADGGSLMSIDASSGAHDWQVQTPEDAQTAPAVQSLDVWLYSRQPAGAWSYVRSNGDVNLAAPDPAGEYNSYLAGTAPVLGDQNDLIVVTAGRVISFDTVAGTIRWQVLGQYTGQPSVHGGSIYVINGGQLQVLDEATHAAQWSWSAPEGSINAPLILTPSFVFASTSSAVHAVSLATKQEVWSYPAAGRLALADSTLYVAGASQLYAFGPPQPPPALGFFTIAPCRIFDTRVASGESAGAPPIFGLSFRVAQVTGKCGIPSGARSISANVTAIDGTGPGELQIGARQGVAFLPVVSYSTVGARANNAMLGLDTNGTLTIAVQGNLSSTYNMAIDVNGYFQ